MSSAPGTPAPPGEKEPPRQEVRTLTDPSGPGVPEALPTTLRAVVESLGVETLDRLWIFPPLIRGRRESGLVAVSRFGPGGDAPEPQDPERRWLITATYTAERTGRGLVITPVLREEGAAPLDRLPRVMEGVIRRTGEALGKARECPIGGAAERFEELVMELETEPSGDAGRTGGP